MGSNVLGAAKGEPKTLDAGACQGLVGLVLSTSLVTQHTKSCRGLSASLKCKVLYFSGRSRCCLGPSSSCTSRSGLVAVADCRATAFVLRLLVPLIGRGDSSFTFRRRKPSMPLCLHFAFAHRPLKEGRRIYERHILWNGGVGVLKGYCHR